MTNQNSELRPKIRCAIYTRKSSEDGLEQEFNSIDAQRLAGENFIASQAGKGWVLVEDHYDDGGFSGGTLERPALKKLFQDIEENKVDCVVIYKIDRLSRSLFDFQKIIEIFDKKNVTFASVTQNFTTDDSVGRLMLNVMLSFAQYERELTGERIRDKVDASKKKGMWMGGTLSLGYDVVDRKLVINEEEAKIVRIAFQVFLETESVAETARELNKHGFSTKSWVSRTGRLQRARQFNKENVRRILENQIYLGKIKHKEAIYDGLHQPIIAEDIWQKTKETLTKKQDNKIFVPKSRVTTAPLLKGIIFCAECGSPLIPTYTKKGSKRYRYYICASKAVGNNDHCPVGRMAANEIEDVIVNRILILLKKPEFVVHTISQLAGTIPESIVINSFKQVEKVWEELFPVEQARIVSLLIKEVRVSCKGINIRIFKEGLSQLSTELND